MSNLAANSIRHDPSNGVDGSRLQVVGSALIALSLLAGGEADALPHSATADAVHANSVAIEKQHRYITEVPEEDAAEYELLQPIPVDFEYVEEHPVACFRERGVSFSFSGVNEEDALDHLIDWIIGTHQSLTEEIRKNPNALGPIPAQQLVVLHDYLRRRE